MLQKFMNTKKKEELIKIMREIMRTYTTDETETALVTEPIVAKLRSLKNISGDLGLRSNLLLKKFQVEEESEMEDIPQAESSRNDGEECEECGLMYLNKANLKRHTQSAHKKRKANNSTDEPRITRARGT